jgi:phosphomannomutase
MKERCCRTFQLITLPVIDIDSAHISQINDPVDGQIADEIARIADMPTAPDCMPIDLAKRLGRLRYLGDDMFQSYIETISASITPFRSDIGKEDTNEARSQFGIAYTPLHGVGANIAERILHRRGFTSVWTVAEQREPDGDFPTVEFPSKCEVIEDVGHSH